MTNRWRASQQIYIAMEEVNLLSETRDHIDCSLDDCSSASDGSPVGHKNSSGKRKRPRDRLARTCKLALLPAIVGVIMFFVGRMTHDMPMPFASSSDPVSLGLCSPDWHESKRRGCVYDFILSTWMHPQCFDKEMHETYLDLLRRKNTTFWYEKQRINEVPWEVAVSGEHPQIFSDGKVHHLHCSYVLDRAIHLSKRKPLVLDSLSRKEEHIQHCLVYNGIPFSWEIDSPNVTRVYNEPYEVDCLVG